MRVYPDDLGRPAAEPEREAYAPASPVTIVVCSSCRLRSEPEADPRPGSLLARATASAGEEASDLVEVRQVACLGNCKRGLSAVMMRDGCWSYVFGELDVSNAPDLIAGAELFARSTDGFMPFRARPESLKRGLIARVPTFDSLKEIP